MKLLIPLAIAALTFLIVLIVPNSAADGAAACNSTDLQTIALFNAERTKATAIDGIRRPTLVATDLMCRIADLRCQELLRRTSHYRPDGSWFSTAYDQLGQTYEKAGEVIAWGYRTPSSVVAAWMRSPTHKALILRKAYTETGVGWCGSTWPRTAGEFVKP